MEEKNVCKIIQDLLPNYIENLTNEETNKYIQEHINKCKECKDILENMKNNINLFDEKNEKIQVNYMKKFKNKMSILKTIILIIIALILFLIINKMVILLNISSKIEYLNENSNFYAKMYTYNGENLVNIIECYYKDEEFITKTKSLTESGTSMTMTMYQSKDNNESILLMDMPTAQIAKVQNNVDNTGFYKISKESRIIDLKCSSLEKLIKNFISIKNISKTNCKGQKCYLIELWTGQQVWLDRESGLPIREIGINEDLTDISDFHYELDLVENVERPNLDGYVIE